MNKYELLYIISPTLTDEAKETLMNKVNEVITSNSGEDVKVDKWGIKKLAYAINFKTEGYYVLVNFASNSTVPAKLTDFFNITEDVMRFICVAK